jgi:rhamnosyltransferase
MKTSLPQHVSGQVVAGGLISSASNHLESLVNIGIDPLLSEEIPHYSIVIPTRNAGARWEQVIDGILRQSPPPRQVLVIDSESHDETRVQAQAAGFLVHTIQASDFSHGGTRNLALDILHAVPVIVYLTQDAIPDTPLAIARLLAAFAEDDVACAYGRQLPHQDATPLAAHARLFNYPPHSSVRCWQDRQRLGIKAAFLSNSFAAYRRECLRLAGGFPENAILSEDMLVAAKLLQAGYRVTYRADALVRHSHNYSPWQEFQRHFDIGAFHAQESWLLAQFGAPEGEGLRFILSEQRYLLARAPWLLPLSWLNTLMKYAGYRMGRNCNFIPARIKSTLSMHPGHWKAGGG